MTSWLAHYGVIAVFVLMMIDAVFPAASELVMVYGGALASGALTHRVRRLRLATRPGLDAYLAVVLAGVLGYQVGSLHRLVDRRPRRQAVPRAATGAGSTSRRAKLERAERWFERWDDWAVFVGRLTPVARSFISIPAGVFESPFAPLHRPDRRSATRSGASASLAIG